MQELVSSLYYLSSSWWNDKIADTIDALSFRFSSGGVSSLAVLMERLSNHVFLPIAGMLATVFLIVRFCSLALDSRGQLDVWGIAKLFIRSALCMALIQNTVSIIRELVTASTKIINNVVHWAAAYTGASTVTDFLKIPQIVRTVSDPVAGATDAEDVVELSRVYYGYVDPDVFDEIGTLWSFVLLIFMIIFVVASALLSYAIYFMALFRIFKVLVYGTFASVAVTTCIGGPEVSRTGFTYMKYMTGLIFSNVLAYVTMLFAGIVRDSVFSSATVTVSSSLSGADYVVSILGVCVGTIAFMAFCCVTVAGVDRVMQRTFAL